LTPRPRDPKATLKNVRFNKGDNMRKEMKTACLLLGLIICSGNAFAGSEWEDLTFYGTGAGAKLKSNVDSGILNTYIGGWAGNQNLGSNNTFIGSYSGYKNTGSANTFIGAWTGGMEPTKGSRNIFIGNHIGSGIQGDDNIFISGGWKHPENSSKMLVIGNLLKGSMADTDKWLQVDGDLQVAGDISATIKKFVQPHPSDPKKEVVYISFEGPEAAIFLRGKARLVDGKASIETPEYFKVVAGEDEDITVQFTPRSLESKGLAAISVTRDKVEVGELMQGKGNYEFDYFITAKRAGFEGHEPIQQNKHFTADMKTRKDFENAYATTNDLATNAMRNLLISNGTLTNEGNLNMMTARELGWRIAEPEPVDLKPVLRRNTKKFK
jgi:hypothetical protein